MAKVTYSYTAGFSMAFHLAGMAVGYHSPEVVNHSFDFVFRIYPLTRILCCFVFQ